MRLHRIELRTQANTVDLPFHHQATVIAGLGRLEREALASEIIAAIGQGRPGLSADISTHTGCRLEIRRPLDGPATVTDVDTFVDSTAEFLIDGVINPTRALEIAGPARVTLADLRAGEEANDRVRRLAALDQDQLWSLAISLAELEVDVARQADDEVVGERISSVASEQIEQARAEVDITNNRLQNMSDQAIMAASSLTMIAFVVAYITHPFIAIPFIAAAVAVAYRSWSLHKQHERALATEQALLDQFGLESYLDFQLRKVDALTSDTEQRRQSLSLAEKRRFANEQWSRFVGPDVSLEWAASHRPTITLAAKQRSRLGFGGDTSEAEAGSLALAERIRMSTDSAESTPLLVDAVFEGQSDAVVERMLWLVDHHCQQLQFIIMSNDPRVLRWGAERAAARHAAVVRLAADADAEATTIDMDADSTVGAPASIDVTAGVDSIEA